MKNLRFDTRIILLGILVFLTAGLVCDVTTLANFGLCLAVIGMMLLVIGVYLFFNNEY